MMRRSSRFCSNTVGTDVKKINVFQEHSTLTLHPEIRTNQRITMKMMVTRFSSRYEGHRPARPPFDDAPSYGRAHWEASKPAGNGFLHRSANPVLPDLQNSSWRKGILERRKPVGRVAVFCPPITSVHPRAAPPVKGGAHV